ncbi:hypothetical protein Nepgr_016099 [Nepenthes gracilis]|uniref:Uncharacterized protein n=1 Tax=Nepenthes gracilis TaxID=150966 RepID=A0AAD3SMW8_NEPGR|nr:hypothetical protein Nepgr_016099 [Nepenthes gracilis]
MDKKDVRVFIRRDEFEKISTPILERVKKHLQEALSEAGLAVENIHAVEVVGGCALECSILIPTFKVQEFKVNEIFPFSIALLWKGSAPETQNGANESQQSTIVFPKEDSVPGVMALTFYRSGTLALDMKYADTSELQALAKISTYVANWSFPNC